MPKITKGWDERRKKRQAANTRRARPWENATGPKTESGKARVARNAFKHGFCGAGVKAFRAALRAQGEFLKSLD